MIPTAITLKRGATTAQDRYAVVGFTESCGPGDPYNMWLVELDGAGNVTMVKIYDFQVNALAGSAEYFPQAAYSANHSVPMDIKPVYQDNALFEKGYIIAGFVTENITDAVPFDAIPPITTAQARRQGCFLRIDDAGNILWSRTIETGAVPTDNHNWTLVNKIIEVPGEGFVFTGQAIQHFNLGGPYGLPGGILTGGFGYAPPATVGAPVRAHITIVNEASYEEACGADPANAVFVASGNDLLYDPNTRRVHLLGSGIQLQGPCCSLGQARPYLIVGEIVLAGSYALDLTTTRLLDFYAIPSVGGGPIDRPAIVGARVFFDPEDPETLIETGYLHKSTFTENGGINGSHPFFLRYHYPSQTVIGGEAYVFPHNSSGFYGSYIPSRTFSPLNNFMNPAGIVDVQTLLGRELHAFSPYVFGFRIINNVVSLFGTPYNNCYYFPTEVGVVPEGCPPFATLYEGPALPNYHLFYTASTVNSLPSPAISRITLLPTTNNCPSIAFKPVPEPEAMANLAAMTQPAAYPVPASDFIRLSASPQSEFVIQNAMGQVVLSGKTSQSDETIDIHALPSGFYMLHVTDHSGKATFIKLTKE